MVHINENTAGSLFHTAVAHLCDSIAIVNLSQQTYTEYDAETNRVTDNGFYYDRIFTCTSSMTKQERIEFLENTNLEYIRRVLNSGNKSHVFQYGYYTGGRLKAFKLTISYLNDTKERLLLLRQDETAYMKSMENFKQDSRFFHFLATHVGENFMEINIRTGECIVTRHSSQLKFKSSLKKQTAWFAENLIITEQKEEYMREFELCTLLRNLRCHNGFVQSMYRSKENEKMRYLLIVSALISDVRRRNDEYIISYVQDITALKEQELKNQRLINIGKQLLDASQLDSLTRLYNRAAGEMFINEYLASNKQPDTGCLFLIDIDYFKCINDTFGHTAGDYTLQHLGKMLEHNFRSDDIICRWGGDEFIVFMRNIASHSNVRSRIQRLTNIINPCKYNGKIIFLNLSIGVSIAQKGDTLADIFKRADTLLYEVKNSGRNGYRIENRSSSAS